MSTKIRYLQALGIDVWTRRSQVVEREEYVGEAPLLDASPAAPAEQSRAALVESVVSRERAPARPTAIRRNDSELPASVAALDWEGLRGAVSTCTACSLHTSRTQSVFGVGNRQAQWMIIGEAPGAEEDKQGEPFVGRAGQLLNAMLKSIGLAREQVFIANILKSRPPHNRDPKPDEVAACIPFLYRQIELINPVLLLCVGRIAAQTLLQTDTPIGRLRGTLHRIANNRPMIVTYHPAYLLRSPAEKRKAWGDLKLAVQTFERLRAEAAA
ncbi:MAG TPA: uracil-DNA glycosylase [Steroidobacteraceae bacterium]|nr:uracil-DNA glycosylase [Steroidobacteraceae bacterium]